MGTLSSVNPATGEPFARFDELDDAELEARLALAAVRATDLAPPRPSPSAARLMARAAEVLEADKERFGRTMTLEMGKTLKAAVAEVEKCALVCRYYAENGERFLADEELKSNATRSYVRWLPLGPVLAVMPWNFPFWQVFRFAAPGAGGGERGAAQARLQRPAVGAGHRGGVPARRLPGGRLPDAPRRLVARVQRIIEDDRVVAATLTGSEWAGAAVASAAGKAIKKTVMELGGSDPFIVMPSADLEVGGRGPR